MNDENKNTISRLENELKRYLGDKNDAHWALIGIETEASEYASDLTLECGRHSPSQSLMSQLVATLDDLPISIDLQYLHITQVAMRAVVDDFYKRRTILTIKLCRTIKLTAIKWTPDE